MQMNTKQECFIVKIVSKKTEICTLLYITTTLKNILLPDNKTIKTKIVSIIYDLEHNKISL